MLGITKSYRVPNQVQDVLPEMYERWSRYDGKLTRERVTQMLEEWVELELMAENENALRDAVMLEIARATEA